MNLIARTILYYRCSRTRIFLRLFKRTYYTAWTSNIFQRFPKEYKHFLLCCTYQTNRESQMYQVSKINPYLHEHKLVHSLLKNSIHYKDSIYLPITRIQQVSSTDLKHLYTINWSSQQANDLFSTFKKLTYSHLNGSHFEISLYNQILETIMSKLPEFNDHMIKILMQCLISLVDVTEKTNVYKNFLKELNKECLKRFLSTDINEMLSICDAFYQLKDYNSDYMWRAMRKMCSKLHKLTGKNLVLALFLLPLCKPESYLNMFEIECRLEECIYELSGNEIGIIARGFFLNKKKIRSSTLMSNMMQKILQSIHNIEDITLTSFMKLVRYSESIYCISTFSDIINSLHNKVPMLSMQCLTHVMHACSSLRIYDKVLIDKILERTVKEAKTIRIKDIERILHAISILTPSTKYYTDVCHELANEIISTYQTRRFVEIEKFPITFARIIMHLSIKDIYIPELIQYTFDPAFIQKIYKNNLRLLTNDILYLYCCMKIDISDYKVPDFKESIYQYLIKKYSFNDDIFRKDNNIKLRTEIVFLCKNKLGVDVYVDYILPHHGQRYIVLGLDENGKSIDVEPILSKMPLGTIKYVNSDELKKIKWKVLFVIPSLAKIRGHGGINGYMCKNIKNLTAVGYTPLLICETEWKSYTNEDKQNYLKRLIFQDSKHELLENLYS